MNVAITGIGIINALGIGKEQVLEGARQARRPFAPITLFDASDFRVNLAAQVPDFHFDTQFGKRLTRRSSRTDKLAITAANEALQQSGLSIEEKEQAGLFMGASTGGMLEFEEMMSGNAESRLATYWSYPVWATARALGQVLDLGGPQNTLMTACSSSAHAIGLAMQQIRSGELDVALAGGAESLSRLTLAGFGSLGVLDADGTKPYDAGRSGLTLGEGAAFLVLESFESAEKRGAKILGTVLGYGARAEAHHMVHPRADGGGALLTMQAALKDAQLKAAQVDYVNAHGTGTKQNDAMEALALESLFAAKAVHVSSTKSMVGHTLGAAAAIEAAMSVLAMDDGFILPSAGVDEVLPELTTLKLAREPLNEKADIAISSSFA
ncbi:beta-ketoacyl-[acyl-carrier-protein] synthase family protein, partial [Myxococcota bacterium]|nr:beta-ketoacyl-[acyl-carrier-protein] synthase family protein [Myxococcota bacterium]